MLEPSHRSSESQRRHSSRRSRRPSSAKEARSGQPSQKAAPRTNRPAAPLDKRSAARVSAPVNPFDPAGTSYGVNQSFDQSGIAPVRQPSLRPGDELRRSPSTAPNQASAVQPRRSRKPRSKRRPTPPFIQGIRLLILGVGIWAIAGTALSIWEPTVRSAQANQENPATQDSSATASPVSTPISQAFKPGQEMTALATRIQPLTKDLTDLTPGVFLADLDNGNYYSLNGTETFAAASTIKVPLLVAFFQDVDAGKIRLDETMIMLQNDVVGESGDMQFMDVGTEFSALEVATNMIVISDNTATNMIIRRLGGIEAVNRRFKEWGLEQTVVRNLLPDLEGTNTTSPKELAAIMALLSRDDLLSMKSRDRALEIMQGTVTDTLLPTSIGPGATIAHKTGDIGSLVGDTGLIDMPSGRRYAITAMVKRPHNDDRAQELIRQIAATAYDYLKQPNPAANPTSSVPGASPTTNSTPADALPPNAPNPQTGEPSPAATGTPGQDIPGGNAAPAPSPTGQQN